MSDTPTDAPTSLIEIPRLGEEGITKLAREMVTNVVYWPPDGDALDCSFGAMLALSNLSATHDITKIGWVYEEIAKAGPMSVNGYPSFLSMKLIHVDDIDPVMAECRRMAEALGITPEPEPEGDDGERVEDQGPLAQDG